MTARLVEERHKTRLQEIRESPLVGDDRQAQLTKETSMRHFTGPSRALAELTRQSTSALSTQPRTAYFD